MHLIDHEYDLTVLQDGYSSFLNKYSPISEDGEFSDGRFHSSDFGKCERHAVLKRALWKGRPEDEDKRGMFAEANLIHESMTKFWMDAGIGIAREFRLRDPLNYPGYSGKFDLFAHNQEWCGCNVDTRALQQAFKYMTQLKETNGDWRKHAKTFEGHTTFLTSLKTVHPNGLRHYIDAPAEHNVWQDTSYAHWLHSEYEIPTPAFIAIMYRSRGGQGTPIWHLVEPYPLDAFNKLTKRLDMAHDAHLVEGDLPPVLPLTVKLKKDKLYPGGLLVYEQAWECGYCEYAGWHTDTTNFRCDCMNTINEGSDRIAVMDPAMKVLSVPADWLKKYGYSYDDVRADLVRWLNNEHMKQWHIRPVKAAKEVSG